MQHKKDHKHCTETVVHQKCFQVNTLKAVNDSLTIRKRFLEIGDVNCYNDVSVLLTDFHYLELASTNIGT